MNYNKDPESWAKVNPDEVLRSSPVHARNVLEMALQDIARMSMEIKRLKGRSQSSGIRALEGDRK
jgi:hypothetical protein